MSAEFRLSDEQREALALAFCQAHDMPEDHEPDACAACEFEVRTIAPLIERIATDRAEAAERALVARVRAVLVDTSGHLCGCVCVSCSVRAALAGSKDGEST